MTRLYDPDTGTIALGGQNTTALSVRQLRQRVATVDQDAAILCCSVLENIAYGAINAGRLDLEQHRVVSCLFKLTKTARKEGTLDSILSKESQTFSSFSRRFNTQLRWLMRMVSSKIYSMDMPPSSGQVE